MILTRDEDLVDDDNLLVVAITGNYQGHNPPYWIPVPHYDPRTGLWKPCVAKCNWVREIDSSDVIQSLGDMPDPEFEQILDCFDQLQADLGFKDWE